MSVIDFPAVTPDRVPVRSMRATPPRSIVDLFEAAFAELGADSMRFTLEGAIEQKRRDHTWRAQRASQREENARGLNGPTPPPYKLALEMKTWKGTAGKPWTAPHAGQINWRSDWGAIIYGINGSSLGGLRREGWPEHPREIHPGIVLSANYDFEPDGADCRLTLASPRFSFELYGTSEPTGKQSGHFHRWLICPKCGERAKHRDLDIAILDTGPAIASCCDDTPAFRFVESTSPKRKRVWR